MRIATWNCQGSFSKKAEALFGLEPDVAVVPECLKRDSITLWSTGYTSFWFGSDQRKGLAVFCRKDWKMRVIHESVQEWIVPIEVKGPQSFTLLAVWTKSKKDDYSGQVYQLLKTRPDWFRESVIVAGDFNSNSQWDGKGWEGCHSDVVKMLEGYGLVSAYHTHFKEMQGAESHPTLYFHRHQDKTYHVDYIFIPKAWSSLALKCRILNQNEWLLRSDHCPLVVEVRTGPIVTMKESK